jgi:hypothetical protein
MYKVAEPVPDVALCSHCSWAAFIHLGVFAGQMKPDPAPKGKRMQASGRPFMNLWVMHLQVGGQSKVERNGEQGASPGQ